MHPLMNRISIDPNVCFGKPCIRGTRIWVSLLLDRLAGKLAEHLVECLNVICGRLLREGDKLDHPGAIGARYPRKAEVMPAPRWWEPSSVSPRR